MGIAPYYLLRQLLNTLFKQLSLGRVRGSQNPLWNCEVRMLCAVLWAIWWLHSSNFVHRHFMYTTLILMESKVCYLDSCYILSWKSARPFSNRFITDPFVITIHLSAKATHSNPFKMSSRILLLAFLSITFGYFQPSRNLRVTPQPKILFSCNNEDVSTFDPFEWASLETSMEPASIPSRSSPNNHASFRNINRILPALSLVATLGLCENADAVADPLIVPMKGVELYSRWQMYHRCLRLSPAFLRSHQI